MSTVGKWWRQGTYASGKTGGVWTPIAIGTCTGAFEKRTMTLLRSMAAPAPSGVHRVRGREMGYFGASTFLRFRLQML